MRTFFGIIEFNHHSGPISVLTTTLIHRYTVKEPGSYAFPLTEEWLKNGYLREIFSNCLQLGSGDAAANGISFGFCCL